MPFPEKTIFVLALVLVVVAITWFYHAYTLDKRKPLPTRRPIPPLDTLRTAYGRGAETGGAIHISPGSGTIGDATTMAETMVGLLAAERVVNQAALQGTPILVSSGDAVSHLALRGLLRQAYKYAGRAHDYTSSSIQLLAHENATAYATGVMTLYDRQRMEASQMIGNFGHEFLLFAEEGARQKLPQVIGTTSIAALPIMILNTEHTLIGEEVFAAEAYLANTSPPQARLMTQDLLRTVVILLIVLGVIYHALQTLQPQLGLPSLTGA
jgi:cbb3-type cytochrome oxidase subunit 3